MPSKSVKELKLFLTSVIIGVLISVGGALVCVGFVTMTKAFDVKLFNIDILPVAFLAIHMCSFLCVQLPSLFLLCCSPIINNIYLLVMSIQ